MIIKYVIHEGNHHPALGPKLRIKTDTNETFDVWAEWLWHAEPNWDGNIQSLVGMELSCAWLEEFVDQVLNQ